MEEGILEDLKKVIKEIESLIVVILVMMEEGILVIQLDWK